MREGAPSSPLELYEKAYKLQYEQKKIPEACRIYKYIIDEFPDSNECAYSVIQLEKILSQSISERINTSSKLVFSLSLFAIIFSVISIIGVVILAYNAKNINTKLNCFSLISQAISKSQAGKDDEALQLLEKAKAYNKSEVVSYLISSEILLKNKKYSDAISELEKAKVITSSNIFDQQINKIKSQEKNEVKKYVQKQREEQETAQIVDEDKELFTKETEVIKDDSKYQTKKKNIPGPQKIQKPKKTYHQDSISFF